MAAKQAASRLWGARRQNSSTVAPMVSACSITSEKAVDKDSSTARKYPFMQVHLSLIHIFSGKLGMPADFIQGMTYLFVRACVHFALFEDEDYLQLQLNAIRTSLRAFIATKTGSEDWKAGGTHE